MLKHNGVPINYRCVGKGNDKKDIVLIHGLATNYAFWHLNILLPLARDYRVTIYDLRGHGYSGKPQSGYTSLDMAGDLHHLINYLRISKVHLAGHSFGGVVALHYAALHPKRVSSLTIADSRIRIFQPTQRPKDWSNWEKSRKSLAKLGLFIPEDEDEAGFWLLEQLALPKWRNAREKLQGRPLAIPYSNWGGGNKTAEKWLDLVNTTTAKKDMTSISGLTYDKLSGIKAPTLGIYGEDSPVLPSLHGLQQVFSRLKTVVVPGAGHFFPLTQPNLFVTEFKGFLKEVESPIADSIHFEKKQAENEWIGHNRQKLA